MSGWRTSHVRGRVAAGAPVRRAAPYVPAADDVVLERLPEKGDPVTRATEADARGAGGEPARSRHRDRRLRAGRSKRRASSAIRASSARRRPRSRRGGPATTCRRAALLLRATLKQSQHDFDGSLDRSRPAARRAPGCGAGAADARDGARRPGPLRRRAARLRASSRPRSAARFRRLRRGAGKPVRRCGARVRRRWSRARCRQRGSADLREWALTLGGGDRRAPRRLRRCGAAFPRRAGARSARRLPEGRIRRLPARSRPAGGGAAAAARRRRATTRLLLRLALAEQRLPRPRDAFAAHRAELAARFDAARRRGDSLHRREEARFRLDDREATRTPRSRWRARTGTVQREPADLRILIEAARAAGDADCAEDRGATGSRRRGWKTSPSRRREGCAR